MVEAQVTGRQQDTSTCPVCGHKGTFELAILTPLEGERFSLHSCKPCALTYTFPQPSRELLEKIYSGEYWTRESDVRKRGAIARLVHTFNEMRLAATVRPLMKRLQRGASILEVGCGSGQLAAYMKQKGYKVEVTDVSRDMLDEIKRVYDIKGYCGALEDIHFSETYDALVFNNVLEHIPHPVETLRRAGHLLSPQGLILIEVPNIASLQFRLLRGSWFGLQVPQHLFHFSPQSIDTIAEKASLERIWLSTFSPRISAAGYVASLFPSLRPEKIRRSWSTMLLFIYLTLQVCFLPLAYAEARAGKGSAVRVLYKKRPL